MGVACIAVCAPVVVVGVVEVVGVVVVGVVVVGVEVVVGVTVADGVAFEVGVVEGDDFATGVDEGPLSTVPTMMARSPAPVFAAWAMRSTKSRAARIGPIV